MASVLMAIGIFITVIYFLSNLGWKQWGKAILCGLMIVYLFPIGIVFAYLYWNMDSNDTIKKLKNLTIEGDKDAKGN